MVRLLKKQVRRHQCELIHAHTEIAGLAAIEVAKYFNILLSWTVHGISTEKKLYQGSARKLLFEYTLNHVNRAVLVGKPLIPFL